MADALRGSMDAAEYKHVVLGLIFLKYISDAFEEQHARLEAERAQGADLGQLIDLVSNIKVGDEEARSKDVLGRVYEYFLGQFASAEGKKGGEFYTPRCGVKLLVEMLEPYRGRVYDPCCGSSGMFVQSVEFIRAHATGNGNGGKAKADISIYGQESNYTTWRLAKMNLAIRGIEGQIAQGDTFHNHWFPDLKADFILANPPFNVSNWGGERRRDDKRWRCGEIRFISTTACLRPAVTSAPKHTRNDGEAFEEKMTRLAPQLLQQRAEVAKLNVAEVAFDVSESVDAPLHGDKRWKYRTLRRDRRISEWVY
jgi:type I restriction-modification system DNA methylase subunit